MSRRPADEHGRGSGPPRHGRPDEEANEFRAQIRRWISAGVPPGLADVAQRIAADAMKLPGLESLIVADGYGLNGRQHPFLASCFDTIFGGTAEIQRNIIAARLLGLPKEPRGGA